MGNLWTTKFCVVLQIKVYLRRLSGSNCYVPITNCMYDKQPLQVFLLIPSLLVFHSKGNVKGYVAVCSLHRACSVMGVDTVVCRLFVFRVFQMYLYVSAAKKVMGCVFAERISEVHSSSFHLYTV